MHIHVASAEGEAKFWMEPELEMARNHGLSQRDLKAIRGLIMERNEQIRNAWNKHFGS